jgi:hypothetical protein
MSVCALPKISVNSVAFPPYLADVVDQYQTTTISARRKRAQEELEQYLLSNSTCAGRGNNDIISRHRINFHRLDDTELARILDTPDSLNCFLHEQLECIISAVLLEGDKNEKYSFTERERVTQWFTHLRKIGESSVQSYAMLADISSQPQGIFIIKTPIKIYKDNLLHEAMVGITALNTLRRIIPNFMYTYGYLRCSVAQLVQNEPATWCNIPDGVDVSYTIIENIRDGVTLSRLISNSSVSPSEFISIMYQIFNALNVAYKIWDFTHYDLHSYNVLVRRLSKPIALPYYGTEDKVTRWIISSYIPFIIDYGDAWVSINGVGLGDPSRLMGRVLSFPMCDVYKLIGFCAESCPRTSPIYPVLETMFSFFGEKESLEARVNRRIPDKQDYYIPNDSYRDITHDDFLRFLEQTLPPPVVVNPKGVWTFTQIQQPFTDCRLYDIIGKNPVLDAVGYCQLIHDSKNSDEETQKYVKKITAKYRALDGFEQFVQLVQENNNEWSKVNNQIPLFPDNINPDRINNLFDLYYQQVVVLMNMRRDIQYTKTALKANLCALAYQKVPSKRYQSQLNFVQRVIDDYSTFLTSQQERMKANEKVLQNIFRRNPAALARWRDHRKWLSLI